MPKALRVILVVMVLLGVGAGWWLTHRSAEDPNRLKLSGTIEVTQVDLAFKIPGRLQVRLVDEKMVLHILFITVSQ